MMEKMSKEQIAALKNLGWDFVPIDPDEWSWLKFDLKSKKTIAYKGDQTWINDLKATELCQQVKTDFETWLFITEAIIFFIVLGFVVGLFMNPCSW